MFKPNKIDVEALLIMLSLLLYNQFTKLNHDFNILHHYLGICHECAGVVGKTAAMYTTSCLVEIAKIREDLTLKSPLYPCSCGE